MNGCVDLEFGLGSVIVGILRVMILHLYPYSLVPVEKEAKSQRDGDQSNSFNADDFVQLENVT